MKGRAWKEGGKERRKDIEGGRGKEGRTDIRCDRKKERKDIIVQCGPRPLRPAPPSSGVLVSTVRWLSSSSLAVAHVCVYSMHA